MPSTEPVHLSTPLTFNSKGVAKTLIQNTPAEVANCVFAICLCPEGFRDDSPEFGLPEESLIFNQVPLDLGETEKAIQRWEPRASFTIEEHEQALNAALRAVQIEVS